MISLRANENVIYTKADKKPDDEDYTKLVPFLQEISRHHESLGWYFELENVKGWTPEGKWENPDFEFTNRDGIKKIAVVSPEQIHDTIEEMLEPFEEAEIRFYKPDNKEEAKLWLE